MGDMQQLDATVRARRIDLAEIELKRTGGALMARIKSAPLHTYVTNMIATRQQAGGSLTTGAALQTILAAPTPFPEMRTYRQLDTTAFREMCGTAQLSGDDGVFTVIRPHNSTEHLLQRTEPVLLSILPLVGPHVATGEAFRIMGLYTTRQMKLIVRGWRTFIENIHREHAVPVIVGVKIITEEYYTPVVESPIEKEVVRAAAE